jgi:hypothetical protein
MGHRGSQIGMISFANGSQALECTVHNSSASGAQLKVPSSAIVPQRFELQDRADGRRRGATVVWRRPGILGVRFDEYFSGPRG